MLWVYLFLTSRPKSNIFFCLSSKKRKILYNITLSPTFRTFVSEGKVFREIMWNPASVLLYKRQFSWNFIEIELHSFLRIHTYTRYRESDQAAFSIKYTNNFTYNKRLIIWLRVVRMFKNDDDFWNDVRLNKIQFIRYKLNNVIVLRHAKNCCTSKGKINWL